MLRVPNVTKLLKVSEMREGAGVPKVLQAPKRPEVPRVPKMHKLSEVSRVPKVPKVPRVPEVAVWQLKASLRVLNVSIDFLRVT